DWTEGESGSYEPQNGAVSFRRARHPDGFWSTPESDLASVVLGAGGSWWRSADAFPPDAAGRQRAAVEPAVVAARAAGLSYGLILYDDTGSEWRRDGDRFTVHQFPNRFLFSRNGKPDDAPYLTVELGPFDDAPPGAVTGLSYTAADLPPGEAIVRWRTPADVGPAGVLGFFAAIDGRPIPRWMTPRAESEGSVVSLHLRDLDLKAGANVRFVVRAVDAVGNLGPAVERAVTLSSFEAVRLPTDSPEVASSPNAVAPLLAGRPIAVVDELDKVVPTTGVWIPPHEPGYLNANHLWNAAERKIRLYAARNEFVGFQIVLKGPLENVMPAVEWTDGEPAAVEWGVVQTVTGKNGRLPDPVVPLTGGFNIPAEEAQLLYGQVYVPHDVAAGLKAGRVTLQAAGGDLALGVDLTVWDFTLPDFLSFLPEMNCYDLPADERSYYRMGHAHRVIVNRVPYYQNGVTADGCTPIWDGRRFDWTAWDRRFGPLLDGTAFVDLPRKGVPLECFYLPFHENWPTPIEPNYNGDYWADHAFPASYRTALVAASRQYAEHFNERDFGDTVFQFFLNGKNNFKERGWKRATSPWILDEPSHFHDFWALRWFGDAFHEGVSAVGGPARMVYRADVSRPQFQRDVLDRCVDYYCVSGAVRSYRRLVMDRKQSTGQIVVEYGAANALEDSNVQPAAWCVDAWSLGCDGVVPWQTIGNANSWSEADRLSLFYPARPGVDAVGPIPSLRLKSFRRGQQDVEYLTLWTKTLGQPRWAVERQVRNLKSLEGRRAGTGFVGGEDAGAIDYARLKPVDLWRLRTALGADLSRRSPPHERRLVDLRTPKRNPAANPPAYVSIGETPPRDVRAHWNPGGTTSEPPPI
ncbi:MAG: hypothetical protein ACRDD1_10705, partial [Planctomycetia bacterium]